MRKRQIILMSIIILCLSCRKDLEFKNVNMLDIIASKEPELQEMVKMRLSLAKVVSIAFQDDEFTHYFKDRFGKRSERGDFFEECLLIRHAEDKVLRDGTTLRQFLNRIRDQEVMGLLGSNFIDRILEHDLRVTLKLPDMFLSYDWDTKNVRPAVFATYPAKSYEDDLVGYHFGKVVEKNMAIVMPQVFHINIKASEDFVLFHKGTLLDEFHSNIFEYLPQLVECAAAKGLIFAAAEIIQDKIVVDLRKAFQVWHEKCSFQGTYIDTSGCTELCQRNCVNPPTTNYVFDHFRLNNFLTFNALTEVYFRETFALNTQFYDFTNLYHPTPVAVPVIRLSELGKVFEVRDLKRRKGMLSYLEISWFFSNVESNPVAVNYLIGDYPGANISCGFSYIVYGDRFYVSTEFVPTFLNQIKAKRVLLLGQDNYEECDLATAAIRSSGFNFVFRY
jgi:hypothetical protein